MDKFPQIEVCLAVEGKNFSLDQLTREVEIFPTETRCMEDWPDAIKNNAKLPEDLQSRCVWCVCTEEASCRQMEIPVRKIILMLKGKEQKLIEFCKRYWLKKSIIVVIHGDAMNLPEIVLPADIVAYLGKLDVEIGFDIYTY